MSDTGTQECLLTARRRDVLREIERCVCQDRQSAHGHAEDNFANTAQLWSVYLAGRPGDGQSLSSLDVAALMVLFKVARIMHNPTNRENWVDVGGYGVCGAGIAAAVSGLEKTVEELLTEATRQAINATDRAVGEPWGTGGGVPSHSKAESNLYRGPTT